MSKGIDRFQEIANNSATDTEIQRYVMRTLVTGEILNAMDTLGINKSDLAAKLHCTKGHVSRMLSGDRNLTIDSISDIAVALGITVSFSAETTRKAQKVKGCIEFAPVFHRTNYSGDEASNDYSYHLGTIELGGKHPEEVVC